MRAAYIEKLGSPDVIQYGDVPPPSRGPREVIVDVAYSTVNHVDTFVRSGTYETRIPFPFVIGRDLVGTVAEAGPDVPGFREGDPVWCNSMGHDGRQGAAAERVAVDADRLYHLPVGADPVRSVAVLHPGATAYLALFTHGRLRAGESVVILGAAGNVGSAALVLAARAGARVVAVASAGDAERCRELGAAEVVDYRAADIPAMIRETLPNGADLHLDTSGGNDLETAVGLLARRGRAVLLAGAAARPVLPVGALYMADRSVRGFAISNATALELAEAADAVNGLLVDGALEPSAAEVVPLDRAAEAHRRLERGGVRGKLVLGVTP
ncbi:NADPH:quinone reductase [Streptomyces tsukubensis]|uniref:Oxidoreductase n=1 Tax=Streptomyces tsukubensis TaxID=83656 RepID=A0A1V4A730_9ACTN|nr:NADPH:quinone reductase [Streptomyces tsukubensis]OON78058.1 oxidoreductase [Streptomyces tsukubensis]QFR97223.1 zinc-binding dehydrogenase [Streptomyces tsukubensis]